MSLYEGVIKRDGIKVLLKLIGKTIGIVFLGISCRLREIDASRQSKKQG
jgi:hypothetical protein